MAQSAAQLANLRPFTPETGRAARAKAAPALRILAAKRVVARVANQTKTARIPLNGRQVARVVSDISARDSQRERDVRTLDQRVSALERAPTRAQYRASRIARYLGEDAVAHLRQPKARTSHKPSPTPIEPASDPSMVEPCWDRLPGAKG